MLLLSDNVNVPAVPSFARDSYILGLVSAVYPAEDLVEEAVKVASTIGSMSMPIALMAKEAVNAAFEGNLTEGVRLERRIFHATFALVSVRVSCSSGFYRPASWHFVTFRDNL